MWINVLLKQKQTLAKQILFFSVYESVVGRQKKTVISHILHRNSHSAALQIEHF